MNGADQFRGFAASLGFELPANIEPGRFVRFPTNGKRGDDAGWAILFTDCEGGVIGDHRTGITEVWQVKRERPSTPAEWEAFKHRSEQAKSEAEAERTVRQLDAAKKAAAIWNAAQPAAGDHPYLSRKGVKATETLREISADQAAAILGYRPQAKGEALAGRLLVAPCKVGTMISTAELIDEAGRKSAIAGGAKSGGYWAAQPLAEGNGDGLTLLIGEGVATVLSGNEASGHPSIAALSAGNLPAVSKAMRERFPAAALVLLADLVKATGVPDPHATEAALSVGGKLAVPDFGNNRPDTATDFNDMAQLCGAGAVERAIAGATAPARAEHQPSAENATGGNSAPYGLVVLDVRTFLGEPIPPRKPILAPIILEQSLTMIHAWRGAGKTHVALGIAYAVSSGGRFLRWQAAEPRKVLYLDGEMPGAALQERLAAIVKTSDREPPEGFLRLATPDKQPRAMPDLGTVEGQAAVDVRIEPDTALIIVDNLSCLVRRGGPENEAESWLTVADWALMHRARGRSILFIHHSGKNGQQRGTSKREDLLDAVLVLKQPRDYNPADGAVFEVHFEKSRGLYGEDVAPFEAKLTTGHGGAQQWAMRPVEDSTIERVIELHGLDLNQNEIAQELGINKSNVCRALKKAESLGRVTRRESGK